MGQNYITSVEHGGHRFFFDPSDNITQALKTADDAAKCYLRMRKRRKTGGPWPVVRIWHEIGRVDKNTKKKK